MSTARPLRVIVAKPGLDGHDRGAKIIARALMEAGMEVIYTGLRQSPEQIVATALQEDADVICLSILSGAHLTQVGRVLDLLRERQAGDIPVLAGGIIPEEDAAVLIAQGVFAVQGPGTPTAEVVAAVRAAAQRTQSPA